MLDQDRDVLAAEYVLGTLGPDERAEAQALIAIDSGFAEIVRAWERRLGELSAMVDAVEPPSDMWERIKAGISVSERSVPEPRTTVIAAPVEAPGAAVVAQPAEEAAPTPVADKKSEPAVLERPPEPAGAVTRVPDAPLGQAPEPRAEGRADVIPVSRPLRRWRAATLGMGALAACLAALVAVQVTNPDLLPVPLQPKRKVVEIVRTVEIPSPQPAEFVAVLQRDASAPAFLLTFDLDKRMLTVRAVGAERQAGKSYELWLVSDKYPAPRSLGVIGTGPYTVRPTEPEYDPVVINRATYAVSLEPEGGSPTGAPTGPVLYTGRLLQATAPDFPARTP